MMMCLKKKQRSALQSLAGTKAQQNTTNTVTVTVTLGDYPEEVSWAVRQGTETGPILYEVPMGTYAGMANGSKDTRTLYLAPGAYTLMLIDAYGDGWNGATITIDDGGLFPVLNRTLPSGSLLAVPFNVSGITCTPTQVPNSNKSVAGSITGVNGDVVAVTCNPGYDGSGNAVCQNTGQFTVPICTAKPCAPTQVPNSDKAATGVIKGNFGQSVDVQCLTGYTGGGKAVCQVTGFFRNPTCTAKPCTSTQVANSDKSTTGAVAGTTGQTVAIACNAGYTGGGNATCQPSGRFTLPAGCTGNVAIDVTVTMGTYPEDIGWNIKQACNTIFNVPTGTYAGLPAGTVRKQTVTLAPGAYTLELADVYGDGWSGSTIQIAQGTTSILAPTTVATGSALTANFTVLTPCAVTQVPNSDKAATGSIAGLAGQTVAVTCNTGYTGSGNAVCQPNGTFTVPTCTAATGAILSGFWTYTGAGVGDGARITVNGNTFTGVWVGVNAYRPNFYGTISGNQLTMVVEWGTYYFTITSPKSFSWNNGYEVYTWQAA